MENLIKGKVKKFGDNIDTDVIAPGKYINLPEEELKGHAFEPLNPRFAQEFQAGDIIIAGKNFGCGSSREKAVTVLKALKIGALVAESFGRIFFRNAIALGIPILVCAQAAKNFEEGEEVEVDLEKAIVTNINRRKIIQCVQLPVDMLEILKKGGILALLKEKVKELQHVNCPERYWS